MRQETGCDAVAIVRGAMLDPWIFARLMAADDQTTFAEPDADEQVQFLSRHFHVMAQQHGDYACIMFRKFAAWYGAKLGIPEDLEDRLRRIESIDEFDDLTEEIRSRHGERESTVPTALIKVPNGPVEKW